MAYKYDYSFLVYDRWDQRLGGELLPSHIIIRLGCLSLPQRKFSLVMLTWNSNLTCSSVFMLRYFSLWKTIFELAFYKQL